MRRTGLIVAVAAIVAAAAHAQDYAREQRWADEIVPAVVVGDPAWLTLANGRRFLSLLTTAPDAKTAIVLVHGIGVHPDHGVIGELRTKLADAGYTTLSVQMPVARGEGATIDDYFPALFPEAGERIETAARFLQQKGFQRIVLLSHSLGSFMSNVFLIDSAKRGGNRFIGWISMGRSGSFTEGTSATLRLPILDVLGERDLPAVRDAAAVRRLSLAGMPGSAQAVIAEADHHYAGRESALVSTIDAFVRRISRGD